MTDTRKLLIALAIAMTSLLVLAAGQAAFGETPSCTDHKVLICHHPPGNPENVQSICIDKSAWPDPHEMHGDTKGECPPPPPVECSIECGVPFQSGPATLSMMVTATGHPMTGPHDVAVEGPVTFDLGTCSLIDDEKQECAWSATGDPAFEGPQSVIGFFEQRDRYGKLKNRAACAMGGAGGLPVELIEFSVK